LYFETIKFAGRRRPGSALQERLEGFEAKLGKLTQPEVAKPLKNCSHEQQEFDFAHDILNLFGDKGGSGELRSSPR
jgi:hypothetical protein